jgi:Tfp pilus assembly protein PilN
MIKINLSASGASRHSRAFHLPGLSPNLGLLFGLLYLGAVGGLGGYWWSLGAERTRLTGEIDRAQTELVHLREEIGRGTTIKARVAEMRKRVDVIETLTRDQGRPIKLIDAFADMIPRDLWITGLEERSSSLRISGTAFSATAVADFMANLRASGRFADVDIVISRQDLSKTPRLVTFEVTCRFEG